MTLACPGICSEADQHLSVPGPIVTQLLACAFMFKSLLQLRWSVCLGLSAVAWLGRGPSTPTGCLGFVGKGRVTDNGVYSISGIVLVVANCQALKWIQIFGTARNHSGLTYLIKKETVSLGNALWGQSKVEL